VFEAGQSPTPISAEKYSAKDSYRIEIGCAFPACRQAGLLLSFAEAKESGGR
jgi:hypothetical protein